MEVWKIIFLSKRLISRFHVNLPGSKMQKDLRMVLFICETHPDATHHLLLWEVVFQLTKKRPPKQGTFFFTRGIEFAKSFHRWFFCKFDGGGGHKSS